MYVSTEHQKCEFYFASLLGTVSWSGVHVNKCQCFQARAIFPSACRKIVCTYQLYACLPPNIQCWKIRGEFTCFTAKCNPELGRLPILIFYLIYMGILPHGVYFFFFLHEKLCSLCCCGHSGHTMIIRNLIPRLRHGLGTRIPDLSRTTHVRTWEWD